MDNITSDQVQAKATLARLIECSERRLRQDIQHGKSEFVYRGAEREFKRWLIKKQHEIESDEYGYGGYLDTGDIPEMVELNVLNTARAYTGGSLDIELIGRLERIFHDYMTKPIPNLNRWVRQ